MKGLHLRSLSGELLKVSPKYAQKPVDAIKDAAKKLWPSKEAVEEYFGDISLPEHFHRLPLKVLRKFSFDELCKIYYSSIFMMHESVGRLFETNARYEIVRKIKSSMWRWGCGQGTWNEVVDAYECIRRFSFVPDPDFKTRMDHSTYWNEFGYAKYSRIFIDGVFAFLVYFKGKHVMTIGFSLMEKKQLLIQQVQSAKRTGNRYLYRLPKNRLEFVIDLFHRNFPGYRFYVIDGESLVKKTLADYRRALSAARKWCDCYRADGKDEDELRRNEEDCKELESRIAHLEDDMPRLAAFYNNGGRFKLGKPLKTANGLTHRQVHTSRTKKEHIVQISSGTPL